MQKVSTKKELIKLNWLISITCKRSISDWSKNNNINIKINNNEWGYLSKMLFIDKESNSLNKYNIELLKPFITWRKAD